MFTRKNVLRACFAAVLPAPPPPNPADVTAAMEAASAAQTAATAAAMAVGDVRDDRDADAVSFVRAEDAADAAMAASTAASAAADAAENATTEADAKKYRDMAEAAQSDADDALADAQMYAGMVATAQEAIDDAAAERDRLAEEERMALAGARTAADMAADMAEISAMDAEDAVAAVMEIADSDQTSYDAAAMEAAAARAAATAAREASDAAARATTSADAAMHQATAVEKRREAATALQSAMDHAGMVTAAKEKADEAQADRLAQEVAMKLLADAKQAAMDAANDAMTASEDAAEAVRKVKDSEVLDSNRGAAMAFARAEDAATDAATAYQDAVAASNAAQMATTQEDADKYKGMAEDAMAAAVLARTNAESFAGIVSTAQQMANDDADNTMRLGIAQEAAKIAAEAAEEAAKMAAEAAEAAETASPGSKAAADAQKAAGLAQDAAGLARDAYKRAMEDTDAADAEAELTTAKDKQGDAAKQLMYAENSRDDAEDARKAAETVQTESDIADAKTSTMKSKMAAAEALADAAKYANMARVAANKAMRARTDYVNADKYADAAEDAEEAARTGHMDAAAAHDAAMAATTSAEAKAAMQAGIDATNSAKPQAMAAMEAAGKAGRYAGMHVIGLLIHANGQDILVGTEDDVTDIPTNVADARKRRVTTIADLIATAANATDNGESDTTATVTWNADVLDDPATDDEDESMVSLLTMALNPGGDGDVEFLRMDRAADPDASPAVTAHVQTTQRLRPNLTGFDHGYSVTDGGTHVIVFTDKEQATRLEEAKTVTIRNHAVTAGRIKTNVDADNDPVALAGTPDDLTTNTKYDHDGNPDTLPLMGTYKCAETDSCIIKVTGTQVTGITGPLIFTSVPNGDTDGDGSPDNGQGIITAAVAADLKDNYIVFGVWLQEEDGDDQPEFGAFAATGHGIASNPDVAVTGKATYTGRAAGVYTAGTSVDYFQGRAKLTADFGAAGTEADSNAVDDEAGTVTGMIDQIVAGGETMSDVISLRKSGNIADGAFSGPARMGEAKVRDDDTVMYPYNGMWSGEFHDPVLNAVGGTADNTKFPGKVAGTFGVTGTDDMGTANDMTDDVVRSYVGAFGAHKDD